MRYEIFSGNNNKYIKYFMIMDACLTPEHSLLGKRHAASPRTSLQGETTGLHTLIMDLGIILISQGNTGTETTSVRADSVGWGMSRHSEYKRCNNPNMEYDTNNQWECVGNYILHDCALFRMHARCHAWRRVTLSTNDVASRLLNAIAIINLNSVSIIWEYRMFQCCLGCPRTS